MEENITDLIPDWCDENFDIVLARNVDEYAVLPLLTRKTIKNPLKLMYKTNRFCFAVHLYCNRPRNYSTHARKKRNLFFKESLTMSITIGFVISRI